MIDSFFVAFLCGFWAAQKPRFCMKNLIGVDPRVDLDHIQPHAPRCRTLPLGRNTNSKIKHRPMLKSNKQDHNPCCCRWWWHVLLPFNKQDHNPLLSPVEPPCCCRFQSGAFSCRSVEIHNSLAWKQKLFYTQSKGHNTNLSVRGNKQRISTFVVSWQLE